MNMNKYYVLILSLLALVGLTGCVVEEAERVEPTEGPYVAFKNIQYHGLDQSAYWVKEILLVDRYLFADEQERNEMLRDVFTRHRIAAMDGGVVMQNYITHEREVKFVSKDGSSIREVGSSWTRTTQESIGPQYIEMTCVEENTWKLEVRMYESGAPYIEMTVKAVPTDVDLIVSEGPWAQQYEVLEAWGKLSEAISMSFWYGSGGFFDRKYLAMEFTMTDPFGLYYDGEASQAFEGALDISYRSTDEEPVQFTATFGSWTDKTVCIRWLDHEKVWRQ